MTVKPVNVSFSQLARFGCVVLLVGLAESAQQAGAQTSFPMLMSIEPVAVQQGTTTEVTVKSRYDLRGTYQVLLSGSGVTAEVVVPDDEKSADEKTAKSGDTDKDKPKEKLKELTALKIRITVDKDALPGVRDLRLATPLGSSTLGQWVVVRDPVISETKNNDTPEKAQPVTLPATLCGVIEKAEDIDCFKFKVEKPGRFTFHMRSGRLEDRIHDLQTHCDPILTLKNASGTVVAEVDNYFFADPLLTYDFQRPGEYLLEVRDVRYQGNAYWVYSVEISDCPFVTNVHPLTVNPGTTQRLELIGYGLPEGAAVDWPVPGDMPEGLHWVSLDKALSEASSDWGPLANPVPVAVSSLRTQPEIAEAHNEPALAVPVEYPVIINGQIAKPGEVDLYSFEAKAGEFLNFEVTARRHQSTIDPILTITSLEEKTLTENDDLRLGRQQLADSQIAHWKVPKDGQYFISIRDLHLRGNAGGVYSLAITTSTPGYLLEVDTDKTLLSPGTSAAVYVRAYRFGGFDQPIDLHVDGLPSGVEVQAGQIPADRDDGCLILTAAADTEPAVCNLQFRGTATLPTPEPSEPAATQKKEDEKAEKEVEKGAPPLEATPEEQPAVQALSVDAIPLQETYMPGGGRGHYAVDMHTLSISPPSDILSIELSTYDVTLKPGESVPIEITIQRGEGFTGNVSLDCLMRHLNRVYGDTLPKGVTIDDKSSKTVLRGKETQGKIVLKADPKAAPATGYLVPVMAQTSINFVMKLSYSSRGLRVSVAAAEDKVAQAKP